MPNPPNQSHRSVRALLDRIEQEQFYGIIAVRYEKGVPVHIRREESILPANIMEKPYDESSSSRQQ